MPDNVHPKAVYAFVQPKPHHIKHGFLYVMVPPVQVGLLLQETMIVILLGVVVPFPRVSTEHTFPVVRWTAVGLTIMPDIPIALGRVFRTPRLDEPGMAVGCMVGYQVENYFQFPAMRLLKKLIEIRHGPKLCVYPGIIGNVITKVRHGRWVYRRYPDGMDSQPLQIIQFFNDPLQVADTVLVRIHKRTRIYLVNNTGFPPGSVHSCNHNIGR